MREGDLRTLTESHMGHRTLNAGHPSLKLGEKTCINLVASTQSQPRLFSNQVRRSRGGRRPGRAAAPPGALAPRPVNWGVAEQRKGTAPTSLLPVFFWRRSRDSGIFDIDVSRRSEVVASNPDSAARCPCDLGRSCSHSVLICLGRR